MAYRGDIPAFSDRRRHEGIQGYVTQVARGNEDGRLYFDPVTGRLHATRNPERLAFDPRTGRLRVTRMPPDPDNVVATEMASSGFF